MPAAGKIFVKTYLKAIRNTFFSQYVEFPDMRYVIILSNRKRKFKLPGLQGNPPPSPPQFPHLAGHPDLPMRKTLWVLVCLL